MQAPFLLALVWALLAPAAQVGPKLGPEPPAPMPRVRVNTLWVVPELGVSWVEPLTAIRKPGGNLYQIDGNLTEYTIANSLRDAIDFLRGAPDKCPGFMEAFRRHDLYFMWEDMDQPRGGPSAGLAFAVGGYAAMLDLPVLGDVAFTGAVDNTGRVKAVAGLALKVKACRQATMRTLCLPAADNVDPAGLDIGLCEEIRLVAVERVEDAFFEAFGLVGPRKVDYDRMLNAWADYRAAKAERRWTNARLALDTILEIQPGDLSARRLAMSYSRLDMSQAAANLFADAATYERDGLRDDALRTLRRAWSYADEPTRAKHRELYDRLERTTLSPEDTAQLVKAEQAMADGDVVAGWRLLSGLCARLPKNAYLAGYQERWQVYAEVAATAAAAEARPDNAVLQSQLAQAYLDRRVPTAAARVYGKLRELEPDSPKWPLAEAHAWNVAGRPEKVAEVLRSMRPKFAVEAALAQTDYNVELRAPELQAPALRVDGNLAWSLVRAADGSGPPRLTAQLDDGPKLLAHGAGGRIEIDLGRLTAGPHKVRVSAVDRFGNETQTELAVEVPRLDAASALRILDAPATLPAGRLSLDLAAAPTQRVPLGAKLTVDGGSLFGDQALAKVTLGEASADAPPYRLELNTTGWTEPRALRAQATLADGGTADGPATTLEVYPKPTLWLASPADGATVSGTVPIVVGTTEPTEGVALTVYVDGQPLRRAPGVEALRVSFDGLASGPHTLHVAADVAGRRTLSPSIVVDVAGPPNDALPAAKPGAIWCLPISLPMLANPVQAPDAAVTESPSGGALRWVGGTGSYSAGQPPANTDTALRLETGFLPPAGRLRMALGDSLAFVAPPQTSEIGSDAKLVAGPVSSHVWTPARPGTWRVTIAGKPLLVTFTESPGLSLWGPPNGARLKAPTRLRVNAVDNITRVALFMGDRPLGTWTTPVPTLELDPTRLKEGLHLLRAVGYGPDGLFVVSPPLAVGVADGR